MSAQPFEYVAAGAVGLSSLFIFLQVSMFSDKHNGWVDRPAFIWLPMLGVGVSEVYKLYAFIRLGEHFTGGGAIIACMLFCWQFSTFLYAIVQSYRLQGATFMDKLFQNHPIWGNMDVPAYLNPEPQSIDAVVRRGRVAASKAHR